LQKLRRSEDDEAWHEFYRLYHSLILGFARKQGCSAELCREVLQEAMVTLMRVMPRFVYDRDRGRFKAYLYSLVRTGVLAATRRQRRYDLVHSPVEPGGPDPFEQVPDERLDPAGTAWDREWLQSLLAQALERVRARVEPPTFRSFTLYVLEERPIDEVCRELGLTPNAVHQHRSRLIEMLRGEMAHLRRELGDREP
jgi:RNA polymerase sigma-70 factor (ECF subfamily)